MNRSIVRAVVAVVCGSLTACASSPPEHFYTLPASEQEVAQPTSPEYQILVGPVVLPEVALRPQMVVRVTDVQVHISEANRWAEPLQFAVPRAIAAGLARRLPLARVQAADPALSRSSAYAVSIEFRRFDATLGGTARLEATWRIAPPTGSVIAGSSVSVQPVQAGSYDAVVQAYGRGLDAIAADIAAALGARVSNAQR
jgi:uncharacterized lipoprotein YmbA